MKRPKVSRLLRRNNIHSVLRYVGFCKFSVLAAHNAASKGVSTKELEKLEKDGMYSFKCSNPAAGRWDRKPLEDFLPPS